jgi:hypothetical protein
MGKTPIRSSGVLPGAPIGLPFLVEKRGFLAKSKIAVFRVAPPGGEMYI